MELRQKNDDESSLDQNNFEYSGCGAALFRKKLGPEHENVSGPFFFLTTSS